MGHSHGHHHSHSDDHGHGHSHGHREVSGALTKVVVMTALFMVVEAVGGYYTNSLALLSDAAHMFSDVAAVSLSLFVNWFSQRPSTPRMSFGYHRAEILGGLASGLSIWVLVGFLGYEAIQRLQSPPSVMGSAASGIALIGLLINLLSMRVLHSSKDHNLNVRGAYLHVLMDCLGSAAAILSGLIIWFFGWRPIDPLVTLLSCCLMLFGSWELIQETVGVLMESAPKGVDPARVLVELRTLAGVQEVHDLHIWSVGSGRLALSVHIISAEDGVLDRANELIERSHGIRHTTIQVEHPQRFKSERCYDCASK